MKVIITKDYEEMSQIAAIHVLSYMFKEGTINLSITGGETPIRMYEIISEKMKGHTFNNIHFYNFDEIPYRNQDYEGITISTLRELFFNKTNIKEENIHKMNETNFDTQDQRIKQAGGLDMVILGIGEDGHFCGNLPGYTKFGNLTQKYSLEDKAKDDLMWEFNGHREWMPDFHITMGPRSIMRAKNIIMIASGERKAKIIRDLFKFEVSENLPSSILTLHPNFTLIIDEDAASLLDKDTREKIINQTL